MLLAGFVLTSVQAQEKVIQPSSVIAMPKITKAEWNKLYEMESDDEVESKYGAYAQPQLRSGVPGRLRDRRREGTLHLLRLR